MRRLDITEHDWQIENGEVAGANAAEAADVLAEVRADLLQEVTSQQDIYQRPPGYPPRPRSGPVADDGTTAAR